jgi:hypothetical protein
MRYAPIEDVVLSGADVLRRAREVRERLYPRLVKPVFRNQSAAAAPTLPEPKLPVVEIVPEIEPDPVPAPEPRVWPSADCSFAVFWVQVKDVPGLRAGEAFDAWRRLKAEARLAAAIGAEAPEVRELQSKVLPPRVSEIRAMVAAEYGVSVDDLSSPARTKTIMAARHIAVYLSRVVSRKSLPEIGRRFGGRDHTTALNSVTAVQMRMELDAEYKAHVEALIARLENRSADAVLGTPAGHDQTT